MKKLALFCGIALSLGFMSCDDELPNPPAQNYPQVPVFTGADLTVSQENYGTPNALNLNEYAAAGELVPVLDITKLENFPSQYDLSIPMEIGSDEDFTKTATVQTTITDNVVYVTAGQLTDAIRQLITKSPEELTINARFPAYAVNGTGVDAATMRLGGEDVYYLTGQYAVIPYKTYTVEETYYMVGSFCNWDVRKGLLMSRAVTEGDVYDNPVFTVKFDVTAEQAAAGYDYKVVPGSSVAAGTWDGAFGFEPATSIDDDGNTVEEMNGNMVIAPEEKTSAGVIKTEGPYLLTIDVEAHTYTLNFAIDYLYVPGNGTSTYDFTKVPRLTTGDYINYQGAACLYRQYWFTAQPSIEGINYKQAEGTEPTVNGLTTSGQLEITDATNGTRMTMSTRGLYWLNVNLVSLRYSAVHLERVSLVGAFNGWNEKGAVDLKPSSNFQTWTGTVDLDGEFKVNTNGSWDIDFGSNENTIGTPNKLDYKGANISVAAGKYDVTVSFATLPYTITLVKK